MSNDPNRNNDPSLTNEESENSLDPHDQADNFDGSDASPFDDFGNDDASPVEKLKAEVEEANRRVLMAHAEVENTRKRLRRDYEDQLKYATLPLIRDVLAVLDNLKRALTAIEGKTDDTGLGEGVGMVAKLMEETLAKYHCKPIPAVGELFDPNFHEAIAQVASDQYEAGVVAQEAVTGYQLFDRVVRPSQVIVSTGKTN